jgi:hypothetical protein
MSLKSKVLAASLMLSLGIIAPNSSVFASDGSRCCGCWTGFVSGLQSCWAWVTRAAEVVDEVLDEADERLEQFQTQVTRLDRRIAALSTIVDLDENEHVLRIRQGLALINGHIELVQTLIGAADDVVENARDGVSIQDVWTAVRAVRTSLEALHEANLINAGHVEGANERIGQVEDRLDTLEDFWNMGTLLVNSYRGFASRGGTFTGEDDEVVIDLGGIGLGGDDDLEDVDV